jgi:hypothetical protein
VSVGRIKERMVVLSKEKIDRPGHEL